jgi:hypothetical protein
VTEEGCPIEGCGVWIIGPWELEGHAAAEHRGWVTRYELLRPYPNQRMRGVPAERGTAGNLTLTSLRLLCAQEVLVAGLIGAGGGLSEHH